ncbi:MAG: cation-transporting P-type ATPase [Candidatus Binatia bacterium]
MQELLERHWHHLAAEEVVEILETDPVTGLPPEEVKTRQQRFGPNQLTATKRQSAWIRFLFQFHQPLLYILLLAAMITALLQEWVDAAVIFGVVLVNAIVGFIQESKAENAIAALARIVTTEATVVRDGKKLRVPSHTLVPGDLVGLTSGDKVPADLRLLRVRDLQVDESMLTGESVPVAKREASLTPQAPLADRVNMAYAGSLVTYGQAQGVVVAIGDATETGHISRLVAAATTLATPLTRKIGDFSHLLLYVILALATLTFAVGLWRGESAFAMFMAAVALAVGAIPEGLPAAVTITLAIGVSRMARRRAIIRKLPAVETLGSTTVICSDKTGTLTENQMTVQAIYAGGKSYTVSGVGYAGDGDILFAEERLDLAVAPVLSECLLAGLSCNDSTLTEVDGVWTVAGDPTEGALIAVARKAGLTQDMVEQNLPRLDVIPFESQHQYMATLHKDDNAKHTVIYMKGAVEAILARCGAMLNGEGLPVPLDRARIEQQASTLASKGLRVLAFAKETAGLHKHTLHHGDLKTDLTFLGLQGMIDPPRPEVIEAVRSCQSAGIAVKMITGDHVVTASAIAQTIGLAPGTLPAGLSGVELSELSDKQLIEVVETVPVFARVAPEHKLRLVKALQARGHIVAMTGDGVNDAPALKQADIGIAMGRNGTEVAKEASDMLLTDDNFASIEAAVEEGRCVFDNLVKFITWTLPTNGSEGLVILAAIAAGVALPILPVQILWVNMTTALLLGLMLAFEPKEADIMTRPPRDPKTPLLSGTLVMRIGLVSLLLLAATFGLFLWELQHGATEAEARTVAVNVLVMGELFYLFNCRSLTQTMFTVGLFSNPWLILGVVSMAGLQVVFTHTPVMNYLFHSAPITLAAWGSIVAAGLGVYVIVGIEKWIRRRFSAPSVGEYRPQSAPHRCQSR